MTYKIINFKKFSWNQTWFS